MTKKSIINAPKKARVFKTRDIDELSDISVALYKEKILYKVTIKTYTPGEPVKFIITTVPMTDEKREEIVKAFSK